MKARILRMIEILTSKAFRCLCTNSKILTEWESKKLVGIEEWECDVILLDIEQRIVKT